MKPVSKIVRTESKFSKSERHEMYLNATDKYWDIENNMGLCQAVNDSNDKRCEMEIFYSRKIDFPEFELFRSSDNVRLLGGYFWSFLQEDVDARLLGLAFMIAMTEDDETDLEELKQWVDDNIGNHNPNVGYYPYRVEEAVGDMLRKLKNKLNVEVDFKMGCEDELIEYITKEWNELYK